MIWPIENQDLKGPIRFQLNLVLTCFSGEVRPV